MVWHLDALYTRDDRGRMLAVNEAGGGLAPRFFLGRTRQGSVWSFRQDQPEDLTSAVEAVLEAPDTPLSEVEQLLETSAPIENRWEGPAFVVPGHLETDESVVRITPENGHLLEPLLSEWIPDVEQGVLMFAACVEDRAVSLCCSVRVTEQAHEAGVETHSTSRGRGHAGRVVAHWARAVRETGATPLYSTSFENESSLRVAAKLRLEQFGTDLHLT